MQDGKNLSVSQLNGYIKSVFDDELILHNISVYGELSQLSVRDNASYFTLSEGNCHINCVIFSALEKIEQGTKLRAYGRISFYSKSGKINFTAKNVTPMGRGEFQDEFLKLKERLKSEGLFENRPRPPIYISQAAVVTSEAGAVIHDIMSVLRNKGANVNLKLYGTAVQGEQAYQSIVKAVEQVNRDKPDIVIIARGGGSNYDLEAFNSEALARAVALSSVPVISAIGHETDFTLCDFCSGTRAGTPSIAAGIIADINSSFKSRLFKAFYCCDSAISNLYDRRCSALYGYASSVVHAMDKRVQISRVRLASLGKAIGKAVENRAEKVFSSIKEFSLDLSDNAERQYLTDEARFKAAVKSLELSNPLGIIAKGYAKIRHENKDVESINDLKNGDKVKLLLKDGTTDALIENIRELKG